LPKKPAGPKIDFQSTIDSIKDFAIVRYDLNGYITTCNASAEYMQGYKAEDFIVVKASPAGPSPAILFAISGSQTNFGRNFSKQFGMTPTE